MVIGEIATLAEPVRVMVSIGMPTLFRELTPFALVVVALLAHALCVVLLFFMRALSNQLPVLREENKFLLLFAVSANVENDASWLRLNVSSFF